MNKISYQKKVKLKLWLKILAGLYIIILLALNLVPKYYINTLDTKKLIQQKSTQYLNQEITIEQDVKLSFGWNFTPTLILNHVAVKGMLNAKQINISISPWSLLFKEIYIKNLVIEDFAITIKDHRNPKKNTAVTPSSDNNYSFMLDHIKFSNGIINLIDNGKPKVIKITDLNLDNDHNELTGNANINLIGSNCQLNFHADISDHNNIKINLKKIQYAEINIYGNLIINKASNSLSGELFSNKLFLNSNSQTNNKNSQHATDNSQYKLPAFELPIAQIALYRLDLSYKITELTTNMLRLNNIVIKIKQANDLLTLQAQAQDHKQQGKITANLNYTLTPSNPSKSTLKIEISAKDTKLENIFITPSNDKMFTNGDFTVASKITTSGASVLNLVANTNGKFLLNTQNATFHKNIDLDGNPIKMLLDNLAQKSKVESNFKCIIANLKINQGTANAHKGIALESGDSGMQGSGSINFNNGNLNLTLDPSGNKIDNTMFLNMLQLTGKINDPKISINPVGVIRQGASAATSLLGGSFGKLVQETLSEVTSAKDPCQTALEQ